MIKGQVGRRAFDASEAPEPAASKHQKRVEKRLSAIGLKTLRPGMHLDGNGLYLVVQESGARSWILRTTVRSHRRDIGLGGLNDVPLVDAREEAARLRSRARKGEDILESRRIENRVIPTFKEVALIYHAEISKTFDSDKHKHNWLRSVEQYIFPVFGAKTIDAVDGADVIRAISPILD